MPNVSLANLDRSLHPVYKGSYQFGEDWFSWNIRVWEKALAPFRGKPKVHYLEVGAFEGRAAFWMIENILTHPSSAMTVIDPFHGDHKARYQANVKASGAEDRIVTITGYSQIELRKIPLDSYDVIYIDGSHRADDVLEDAVLAWRLVKQGGLLIFDDYRWTGWKKVETIENRPGPAIDVFYQFYGKHFEVIHNGYQVILRKK